MLGISSYLVRMKNFMRLLGDDFTTNNDIDYPEELKKISNTIIYKKFSRNRIVVKFGDEGKNFFLILKGNVQVILPIKKNIVLQQKELRRYLLLLYIYKEYEILKLVIKDNKLNKISDKFDISYYFLFFLKEENFNINNSNMTSDNNDNSNNNNSEDEDDKSNNNDYELKDYKFGFNRKIKRKSFTNINEVNNNYENNENNKLNEEKRVKILKKLMKYYLTEDELAYYERTKDVNLKEADNDLRITPNDYIKRILDFTNNNIKHNINSILKEDSELFIRDKIKSNYFIYEYKKLMELQTGDIFGDLALTEKNIIRTATMISIDECHFACLTKELYSDFIENANEKVRKNKLNYLYSINILKNFPKFILKKKLFTHFGFKNFIKDIYIVKSKEINDKIIFLKDGIFEISFTGKFKDLSDLINFFYNEYNNLLGKKEREELDKNLIDSLNLMEKQRRKIFFLFQKYLNEEFSYVLFLVNAPSIFGFRETEKMIIKEKNKIYYSNINIKCQSLKGEYVHINKKIFYKFIYGTDSFVQEDTKLYVLDFLRKIMKRLLNIRYIKLWNFFLSVGIDKDIQSSINLKKMEKTENIYEIVNKLLLVIKEGQVHSDQISLFLNNYFETLRKKNKINSIKIITQNYQTEKFKKIILSKQKNNKKKYIKLYFNVDKYQISSKNSLNILNTFININKNDNEIISNNKPVTKLKEKMKELFDNKSSNNFSEKTMKIKLRSIVSSYSLSNDTFRSPNNREKLKSKNIININNKNNYLNLRKNRRNFILTRSTSVPNKGYSCLNRRIIVSSYPNSRLNSISTLESNKNNNNNFFATKNIFNKIDFNNVCSSINCYNTTKPRYNPNNFDFLKKRKEKYIKGRNKYIIKNTRILFTKSKIIDKYIRLKRVNSACQSS